MCINNPYHVLFFKFFNGIFIWATYDNKRIYIIILLPYFVTIEHSTIKVARKDEKDKVANVKTTHAKETKDPTDHHSPKLKTKF